MNLFTIKKILRHTYKMNRKVNDFLKDYDYDKDTLNLLRNELYDVSQFSCFIYRDVIYKLSLKVGDFVYLNAINDYICDLHSLYNMLYSHNGNPLHKNSKRVFEVAINGLGNFEK